jgi:colanic acid biosynthesis glycosyl transferase WcaI
VIYNAQELWPDVPRDLGVITNPTLLGILGNVERFIYRRSAVVTAIGERFADEIRARGGRAASVEVVPNFVDTSWISPRPKDTALARAWGVSDRPVVLYAGNLGLTQDFDLLLDVADRLPDISIVIVGGGAGRGAIERSMRNHHRPNVILREYQPADVVADLYGLADIVAVPLKAGHDRTTTPSKIFSAMAAGKPVLACAAADTDLASELRAARAGIVVPPGDVAAFAHGIRQLLNSTTDFDRSASITWTLRRSPESVARSYHELILRVALNDRCGDP